ncbi:conserved hypothetical protein [Thiomonas arsenitoxydans]|nr:conserved hypothetical protein [Thiomonas arsenitoxydans]CQR32332.1 conserved hypothetical protein [Thiomonas arsenitoxydans]CQR34783.1 conserved hypothetical protein [Thiomonas arsenitoxydans]CQR40952.1 conserved hypothetical protein [Thiomonas arsenitoxydans]
MNVSLKKNGVQPYGRTPHHNQFTRTRTRQRAPPSYSAMGSGKS